MSGSTDDRGMFDSAASTYQAARPDYPGPLYGDLLAIRGQTALASARGLAVGHPGDRADPSTRRGHRLRRHAPLLHRTVLRATRATAPEYCTTGTATPAAASTGPGIGDGRRRRVGVKHPPLPALLIPVLAAEIRIERFVESTDRATPLLLTFRALRAG